MNRLDYYLTIVLLFILVNSFNWYIFNTVVTYVRLYAIFQQIIIATKRIIIISKNLKQVKLIALINGED